MEMADAVDIAVPLTVVAGGQRRQDSVYAGLHAAGDCTYVAIHDGARPFPPANLEVGLQAARYCGGAIFAMPATDSIKVVQDEIIKHTIPRSHLWAAQTPQIFQRARLMAALEACDSRGAEVTDDASAFEAMGWEVAVVEGSRSNIKITYQDDFIMAEALLKGRTE
jgi:2-C-methyl-D-erythritol 4-phosphate cytidylyltransferase